MPLFVDGIEIGSQKCDAESLLSISVLKKSSQEFCNKPVRKLTSTDKILYVNQREYATVPVDDNIIRFVGSEDATTCHIVIMKTENAVSVGHFDGADTKNGLIGMVNEIQSKASKDAVNNSEECGTVIEVHMFGGFLDSRGISKRLLGELLDTLQLSPVKMCLMTASVYYINNTFALGNNQPVVCGAGIDIRNGEIFPATFADKGPCEVMRHARIFGDSPEMFSIYNFKDNLLLFGPFLYKTPHFACVVLGLDDNSILECFSTSPHCEPENFPQTVRKAFKFLMEHPDPKIVFKDWKPLVYRMDEAGKWL